MFECKKCRSLEKQVEYLQETNAKLIDRLVTMSDKQAFASVHAASIKTDPDQYHGNGKDEVINYDELGREILVQEI